MGMARRKKKKSQLLGQASEQGGEMAASWNSSAKEEDKEDVPLRWFWGEMGWEGKRRSEREDGTAFSRALHCPFNLFSSPARPILGRESLPRRPWSRQPSF